MPGVYLGSFLDAIFVFCFYKLFNRQYSISNQIKKDWN